MITDQQVMRALMRENLAAFIAKVFQTVSPSTPFCPAWYIDVIADYLMRCYLGEITRLIITVPPRSLKSISASIAFPAWVLGKDPTQKIICASYSSDFAATLARDCRAVMLSSCYTQLFPWTRLTRSAELDLMTTRSGVRFATSVGGTLTGRGGSLIIIDDPLKPQDALSEAQRKTVKQWYDNTLYSRLDNKMNDRIVLVQQRLHVDDLVAHVMEKEGWVHLNLPAIATCDQTFELSDGRRFTRRAGDVLHPEREPLDVLEKIRSNIGSFNFEAQYQQQPVPIEGYMVKWEWFQIYETPPPREHSDQIIQSWDTASTSGEMADFSVCSTWLIKNKDYYLIDVYRRKLQYPDLRKAIVENAEKYRPDSILIEDTGTGQSLLQEFRNHGLRGIPYPIPITPKGDKIVRMSAQSAKIESGHVHLPCKAPWLDEFRKELLAFPYSQHDDQVDSLSQLLNWYENRPRIEMVKLSGL